MIPDEPATTEPAQITALEFYGPVLIKSGYDIVPIMDGEKWPMGQGGWETREFDEAKCMSLAKLNYSGVGIKTGRVVVVDVDLYDEALAGKARDIFFKHCGVSPYVRVGMAPKMALIYRVEQARGKINSSGYFDMFGNRNKIEILGDGQQFVAYGVHPDTGKNYQWIDEDLASATFEDLPLIDYKQIDAALTEVEADILNLDNYVEQFGGRAVTGYVASDGSDWSGAEAVAAHKPKMDDIDANEAAHLVLRFLPIDGDHDYWFDHVVAIHHQFDGDERGYKLALAWTLKSPYGNEADFQRMWDSIRSPKPGRPQRTFRSICNTIDKVLNPNKGVDGEDNGDGWRRRLKEYRQERSAKQREVKARENIESDQSIYLSGHEVDKRFGPIDWLIDGVLERNASGVMFGDSDSYKSFIALDWALSVASGRYWKGLPVKQGPVIIIAGEGANGISRRQRAWEARYGSYDRELFVYRHRPVAFTQRDKAEQVKQDIDVLIQQRWGGQAPALIVIDTVARNFGANENSTEDMTAFVDNVYDCLQAPFGCTVLCVHHTGKKDGDSSRGSGALRAGSDFEMKVERGATPMSTSLSSMKMKDAPKFEPMYFQGDVVDLGGVEQEITSLVFDQTAAPIADDGEGFGDIDDRIGLPVTGLRGKQREAYIEIIRLLNNKKTSADGVFVDRNVVHQQFVECGLCTETRRARDLIEPLIEKGCVGIEQVEGKNFLFAKND